MEPHIIIVVNSEEEKEYGQILKNLVSASGLYEAALWTTKQYTDNEPKMLSSQKVIFIGENNVSKRNLSTVKWRFESANMKYGWVGSVALLTVGDTVLLVEELKKFEQMCKTQADDVEKSSIGAAGGWREFIVGVKLGALVTLSSYNPQRPQKLAEQKKEQYNFLINHFILNNIENYMANNK